MKKRGYSLIELLFVVGLLALVMFMAMALMKSSHDAYAQGSTRAYLYAQARDVVEGIARDIRPAGIATLNPATPFQSPTLTFRKMGVGGNFDPAMSFSFALAQREILNGKDDNSNGLIDEGHVVRTEAGKSSQVTGDNVPSGGLKFTLDGSTVKIELTLQQFDENKRLVTVTAETSVQLRN